MVSPSPCAVDDRRVRRAMSVARSSIACTLLRGLCLCVRLSCVVLVNIIFSNAVKQILHALDQRDSTVYSIPDSPDNANITTPVDRGSVGARRRVSAFTTVELFVLRCLVTPRRRLERRGDNT